MLFIGYLWFAWIDLLQTFVNSASWDKAELTRFWSQAVKGQSQGVEFWPSRFNFLVFLFVRTRVHGDRRRRGIASRRRVPGTSAAVPASQREEDAETIGTRQETCHSDVVRIYNNNNNYYYYYYCCCCCYCCCCYYYYCCCCVCSPPFLMKLFCTSESNNDIVNECRTCFEFSLPSEIIPSRTVKFMSRLSNVASQYCSNHWYVGQ